jgi:hypothetical protein
LPDLHPIALVALGTKVVCVVLALALGVLLLARRDSLPGRAAWVGLAAFGGIALCAAAVLRWSS